MFESLHSISHPECNILIHYSNILSSYYDTFLFSGCLASKYLIRFRSGLFDSFLLISSFTSGFYYIIYYMYVWDLPTNLSESFGDILSEFNSSVNSWLSTSPEEEWLSTYKIESLKYLMILSESVSSCVLTGFHHNAKARLFSV